MNRARRAAPAAALLLAGLGAAAPAPGASAPAIRRLDPPEQGFYAKRLDYEGIPIKASAAVSDEALVAAYARLFSMLHLLPAAVDNLKADGAELHIIGKDQVTSDLPEYRDKKGKPFDGDLDVDQRTRGLGGVTASCGEENLLRLEDDRYFGRDICVHEFAHTLHVYGLSKDLQDRIAAVYRGAMERGLWKGAYAATNDREYFAELSMWYFGTRGDEKGLPDPKPGPRWLRGYDPEGYELVESVYAGAAPVARRKKRVALAKLPPERESGLRSHGGDAVTVLFVNDSGRTVRLYWLDFTGRRKPYGVIPPGGRQEQRTYTSHPFVIADEQDRARAIFVAGSEDATAVVEDADLR